MGGSGSCGPDACLHPLQLLHTSRRGPGLRRPLQRRRCLGGYRCGKDQRCRTNTDRTENRAAIDALVSETIITREAAHWIKLFAGVQVPCVPIQNIAEIMDDEQVKTIGIMQPEPDSGVSYVGMPFNVNGERPQIRKVASTLEEATQARVQVATAVAAGESPFEKLFG